MPSPREESDGKTRRNRVDPQLARQGWKVVAFDPRCAASRYTRLAVTKCPIPNGPAAFVAAFRLAVSELPRLPRGDREVTEVTPLDEFLTIKPPVKRLGVPPKPPGNWPAVAKIAVFRNPVSNYRLLKKTDLEQLLRQIEDSGKHPIG